MIPFYNEYAEKNIKDYMKDMIGVFDNTNSYLNNEYPKDFDIDIGNKDNRDNRDNRDIRIVDIDKVLDKELSDMSSNNILLDKSIFINSLFETVMSILNKGSGNIIPIVSRDFVSHNVVIDFVNIRISVSINLDKSFKVIVYVRSNNNLVYKLEYTVYKSKDTDLYFKIYSFVYNTNNDNNEDSKNNKELQSILNLSNELRNM